MGNNATATNEQDEARVTFAPGVSGNPRGRGLRPDRVDEIVAQLASDFGKLSAADALLLRQAAQLLDRSERASDGSTATSTSNAALRILADLRERVPKAAPAQSLAAYLAARPVDDEEAPA
jgi:hypothetical protein